MAPTARVAASAVNAASAAAVIVASAAIVNAAHASQAPPPMAQIKLVPSRRPLPMPHQPAMATNAILAAVSRANATRVMVNVAAAAAVAAVAEAVVIAKA